MTSPTLSKNVVELVASVDSIISAVRVYKAGRAEVTRIFRLTAKEGKNEARLKFLPRIDHRSLRIEGQGAAAATIHEVTLSTMPAIPRPAVVSPKLTELNRKKTRLEQAQARCRRSLSHLETYIKTIGSQHIHADQIQTVMETYETTSEELENKLLDLNGELLDLGIEIHEEQARIGPPPLPSHKLDTQASVGLFCEKDGPIELTLTYTVYDASWEPSYDVRVDLKSKETNATITYKALVVQNTGEVWNDVPLTLETVTPSFGASLPTVNPWVLSFSIPDNPEISFDMNIAEPTSFGYSPASPRYSPASPTFSPSSPQIAQPITYTTLVANPVSHLNATFAVPGLATIPSDGLCHNLTIAELKLDAAVTWVAIPKYDSTVHLKAKIANASDYTLMPGNASIYLDGIFISQTSVGAVSPQETFDCSLGIDHSIRLTYHPRSRKVLETGFYSKTTVHAFSQSITIQNTKASDVKGLKIIDQVPVSEDAQITVKLLEPALPAIGSDETPASAGSVRVSKGVTASWEGEDRSTLGKDGKLCWMCDVPPHSKINVTLKWQVSTSIKSDIVGL